MDIKTVVNTLAAKVDGQQFAVFTKGKVDLSAKAKKAGHTAYKETMMPVVKGVPYAARKSVQEKLANGYELTHELPWGEWSTEPGEKNLIINHKGNKYLRLYLEGRTMTKYYLDNVEVTREQLKESGLCIPSFFKAKTEPMDTMTVNIDNILTIV